MSPADSGSQQATPRQGRPHHRSNGLAPARPALPRRTALPSVRRALPDSALPVQPDSVLPSPASAPLPPDSVLPKVDLAW